MKEFNAKETAEDIIQFIKNYYKSNNLKGAVIGISGGKDSSVVAGLFTKALGCENVYGLWMPCHSKDTDKNDAYIVANHFGFEISEFDLTNLYDNYVNQIKELYHVDDTKLIDSNINIKPRLRMTTLYYHAAMLSRVKGGTYIVPGTSNKCELYVGYFTKGGDSVSDIQVLADLTVDEVIKVGEVIGVPSSIVHKVPDDGLSGKTDEDKMGIKYSEIEEFINNPGTANISEEAYKRIRTLHNKNKHKFDTPTFKK